MPASLSPLRTAVLPARVAIMTFSTEFTARRASERTVKQPSQAARSSILPSLMSSAWVQPAPSASLHSRRAASFSCSMPGCISQT